MKSELFESPVFVHLLGLALLYAGTILLSAGILYIVYFVLTVPMRRNERARLFLDLLELGLQDGRTPELAIVEAAASRDRSMGARFHALAAHLQSGIKLSQALSRVPRLLPPAIAAMIRAGERIGAVSKVLPACRQLLNDGVSQVRGALNYLLVLMFVITPGMLTVPFALHLWIVPKFREIFAGMFAGAALPPFTAWLFDHNRTLLIAQAVLLVFVWVLLIGYIGGPRLRVRLEQLMPGLVDGFLFRLPWRQKRWQRDFSAMLAILLDAGMPESDAVALAGESTANRVMQRRANQVCRLLQGGRKLPQAIEAMDDSGELRWRLTNALQRGRGFMAALCGWHEALDARAFQLEQSAAQVTTSVLVLLNGAFVAAVVIAVFSALIHLINGVALW